MPQHWVGRPTCSPRWLLAVVLAVVAADSSSRRNARAATTTGATAGTGAGTGAGTAAADAVVAAIGDGSARLQPAMDARPDLAADRWSASRAPESSVHGARSTSSRNRASRARCAARGGIVNRPCPNTVEIRTRAVGRRSITTCGTSPYATDSVLRGAKLGWTSTRSGCGGFASGAHLHFSLKWQGDFINLRGNAIGGWTVREGDVPYAGCLVRDGVRRCAPKDPLMNRGADRRRLKGTASRYRVTSRDSEPFTRGIPSSGNHVT